MKLVDGTLDASQIKWLKAPFSIWHMAREHKGSCQNQAQVTSVSIKEPTGCFLNLIHLIWLFPVYFLCLQSDNSQSRGKWNNKRPTMCRSSIRDWDPEWSNTHWLSTLQLSNLNSCYVTKTYHKGFLKQTIKMWKCYSTSYSFSLWTHKKKKKNLSPQYKHYWCSTIHTLLKVQ